MNTNSKLRKYYHQTLSSRKSNACGKAVCIYMNVCTRTVLSHIKIILEHICSLSRISFFFSRNEAHFVSPFKDHLKKYANNRKTQCLTFFQM